MRKTVKNESDLRIKNYGNLSTFGIKTDCRKKRLSQSFHCDIMFQKQAKRFCSAGVKTYLRQAQSIELFRSKFCQTIGSDASISLIDIDDLVKANNVRPSSLIAGIELLGFATGVAYKLTPSPVRSYIVKGVNDAVSYQLNNSIRDLQEEDLSNSSSSANDIVEGNLRTDVKDTLKFHRDVSVLHEDAAATGSSDSLNSNASTPSNTTSGPIAPPNVVGLVLGTVFDLTKTL